ncbi:MAG: GNAT family N-acetyltransferase [Pseudomonadota bacterium]|nr:GNAT family N-acetyltransferase [Pseudomonadota bacterium]
MDDARPYRDAINQLNLGSSLPDPFSTFEFYDNIMSTLAASQVRTNPRLWLLLAFDADQLVGYLPLKECVHRVLGMRSVKLDLLTAYRADRPHLVTDIDRASEVSRAIYDYLLSRKAEWSLLEFEQQNSRSALWSPPPIMARSCDILHWPNMANSTVTVRWSSMALYFAALSKKFRSNVSRQMRSLLAAGEVELISASDPRALLPLFELYCDIEANSWKSRSETAFSSDRQWIAYYQGLMRPDQPMPITIQILLLDGLPIAGFITGAFKRDLYALHVVYDERLSKLAPGSAILLMGMRLAVDGGYGHFNLMHGFGYYKSRWLADMSETESLQFYRIGSAYYWKRKLGDARRRWSGHAPGGEPVLFNAAKRDADSVTAPDDNASLPFTSRPQATPRHCVLADEARRYPGTFLSGTQLATILPFEARRPTAAVAEMAAQIFPTSSYMPRHPSA